MASNNLRVIYQNWADLSATTIVASTTAGTTTTSNLKLDTKSKVWRSIGITATLTVTLSSAKIMGGIVLPFCNLTSEARISVTIDSVLVVDNILAAPYQALGGWSWGELPLGVNAYAYGAGTYARAWFPQQSGTVVVITITDTNNTAGYIECSRLVLGAYWSPTYNTSFGLSMAMKDLSSHERSEAGDMLSNRGIRYNSMTFDLKYLTAADRLQFTSILRGGGLANAMFISLFPDNSEDWAKEQTFQIYGKLPSLAAISHPIFGMYSTQVEIEEV